MEDPPKKFFRLAPGREVRLRYGYFIKCTDVVKDEATGEVVELRCTYDKETRGGDAPDGRKVKATMHWVSARHAVEAEVRLYDNLFNVPSPKDMANDVNRDSLEVIEGARVEPSVVGASPGTRRPAALDELRFARCPPHALQGRRHLRLLRLQRIVRWCKPACPDSSSSSPLSWIVLLGSGTTASPPRVWSCSRPLHSRETWAIPNLPDGTENNTRLAMLHRGRWRRSPVTRVFRFVDLLTPNPASSMRSARTRSPSTASTSMPRATAESLGMIIDEALSPARRATCPPRSLLTACGRPSWSKNLRWFNRYRATDGYSTYGRRAYLKFVDGQTNKDVMDRELEIIDVMTANRDQAHLGACARATMSPSMTATCPSRSRSRPTSATTGPAASW